MAENARVRNMGTGKHLFGTICTGIQICLLVFFSAMTGSGRLWAQDTVQLDVLTDLYPPYSYKDDSGAVTGISVDKVRNLLDSLGVRYQIIVMPWSRALQRVQTTPNSLIFSLNRTPDRENQFEWLIPLNRVEYHLIGLPREDANAFSRESAIATGGKVLCEAASSPCQMLADYGFHRSAILPIADKSPSDLVRLLLRGRADYLISDPVVLMWHAERTSPDIALHSYDLVGQGVTDYLAAGKLLPRNLVQRIQRATLALETQP